MSLMIPPFGSGQVVELLLATFSRVKRLWFFVIFCAACMFSNHVIYAADGVYYPGSVWTSNGTLSPVEKHNFISQTHVEQGIAIKGAEVFGSLSAVADSKGFDWNRRTVSGVGFRFTQNVGKGMVRAGVQYLSEKRYVSESTAKGISFNVDAYFGWGQRK